MSGAPAPWIGIDIAKATLEVAIGAEATSSTTLPNGDAGWVDLIALLTPLAPAGIVLEATGSLHVGVTVALADAGLAPAVINPQRMHAFIQSEGVRTKTDRSDARLLARFGQQKQPQPSPVLSDNARELKELLSCRADVVTMLVMEKNRQQTATAVTRSHHEAMIAMLEAERALLDTKLAAKIASSDEFQTKHERLRSVPGIGPVTEAMLLANLPELGVYSVKAIASLAGLAPHPRSSGTIDAPRFISGGRALVRTALYQMATTAIRWSPVIRTHYEQLRVRTCHKVAIIACARRMLGILTAMLRDGLHWQDTKVAKGHFLSVAA